MDLDLEQNLDVRSGWLCGRILGEDLEYSVCWAFRGIFDVEIVARAHCRDERDFIAPIILDTASDYDIQDWPGLYYPRAKPEPAAEIEIEPEP